MTDKSVDFEKWLYEYYAEHSPDVLDDNLSDATDDWIANLDSDDWIDLANKYAKKVKSDAKTQLRELVMGCLPYGFDKDHIVQENVGKTCSNFARGFNQAITETTKAIEGLLK